MDICIVCDRPVKDYDDFIWHGLDGDKIHKSCKENLQYTYDKFNNMTAAEFGRYLRDKKGLKR